MGALIRSAAMWRRGAWRLAVALLLAPAAALAGAELLVVMRGRMQAVPIPSGVHSYLPILVQVGRDRYEVAAAVMGLLAVVAVRWRRRLGVAGSAGRGLAGWLLVLPLAQLALLAIQVVMLGGTDGVPDALPTTLSAVAIEMVVATALLLAAAWAGRTAVRVLRRRGSAAPHVPRLLDARPRLRAQRVVTQPPFATPTHRGPPARVV